jgi:hypothetical protein
MTVLSLALLSFTLQTQSPASSYEQRYAELMGIAPREDRAAAIRDFELTRDAARFTLASGTLHLLTPIGGRTVGAVFRGAGTFTFVPRTPMERDRLARFERTPTLDAPFSELVLFFTDTTAAELEHRLTFAVAPEMGVRARVRNSLDFLGDDDSKTIEPDLMAELLNGGANGVFYAHIERDKGGPLMFMINPFAYEGVSLSKRAPRRAFTREPEVICQFPVAGTPVTGYQGERRRSVTIREYTMDVTLASTGTGDLSFAATANLALNDSGMGPWAAFTLFSKLEVDSARWDDGQPATVFRGKEADLLWVRIDEGPDPQASRRLVLRYHGDLIDRFGDFFYIKSAASWYPRSLEGRSLATFDLTFHTPSHYMLASVGTPGESDVRDKVRTSHWATSQPIRNASFNVGAFDDYRIEPPGGPAVVVMLSELAHRAVARAMLQEGAPEGLPQKNMKETVGHDVVQSMQFFQRVYGPAPAPTFYATEIPYSHGEAFPGLVHLAWSTFHQTDNEGWDEVFRAHEVAHQWWGIGVDFATYHDQWLSEGFATFSGLWYLHAARRDNDRYLGLLRRFKNDIFTRRDEPSPIWLGYRASSSQDPLGYQLLIYEKGAWILHMLRILMLDLGTAKEDRFTAMLQDFYNIYRGGRASTADFQQVVERHRGTSMDWFFNQWVYGTAIPTYRVAYKSEQVPGGQYKVTLRVDQANVPDDFFMPVPVTVELADKRQGRFRVNVRGPRMEVELPLLPAQPRNVKFNDLDAVLAEVKMVNW